MVQFHSNRQEKIPTALRPINYSSSFDDDEALSEDEDNEFFEREGIYNIKMSENGIQTSNEVLTQIDKMQNRTRNEGKQHERGTKNTNQLITVYDRKQRKIQSTKKKRCKFCNHDLISKNFVRHIETFHSDENEVKKFLILPKKSKERREAFTLLGHDTNFELFLTGEIRPCRKPDELESKFNCFTHAYIVKDYLKRSTLNDILYIVGIIIHQ
ncbi:hypothetical protein NQ314_009449 [Rhamnusium bicolor]|uniref:C2H2-type domain-containing protein n=1 Tax=Rhamnusium bicolor TaxID=1586634 RepID=A0AAV8Y0N6_9CUCU|nr:hypothetical protein NQ314_009449 [Rhamnusium bicolor]